jgi:anaerobic selenocysteine-containing dehydrogenase
MVVTVKDGKAVKVEGDIDHPESRGALCPKGKAALEQLYSPDRLLYPLKRTGERGEEKWERVSWEEALNIIVDKLLELKENYGPESVWFHKGSGHDVCAGDVRSYLHRFANVYGSPNISCPFYICYGPRVLNLYMMTGAIPAPDVENTKCVVLWGINPASTALTRQTQIQEAIKRDVKLIVVDPRVTNLASEADIHLQPRPGSDGALALGMLNVIIEEDLFDKEFVSKWTTGFDELKELVKDYPPKKVEEITWVPREEIQRAARLYAVSRPSCIFMGNALDQINGSSQAIRSIASLIAITGNLDAPGGNVVLSPGKLAKSPIELYDVLPPEAGQKRLGNEYLLSRFESTRLCHPPSVYKAILSEKPYPVKAAFLMASNPMLMSPNTTQVKKALEKLSFVVVVDIFMTETARMADIVLPASTFLEQTYYATYDSGADLKPNNPGLMMLRPQVVPPQGESKSDWQIISEIAKQMGYNEYFPWRNVEETIDYELKPTGITYSDLMRHPEGVMMPGPSFLYQSYSNKGIMGNLMIRLLRCTMFRSYPKMYYKYKRMGFMTPTKKVELSSKRLHDMGYDALPVYHEAPVGPFSTSKVTEEYPIVLTTGAKIQSYVHSQMRNLPSLRRQFPQNMVELHPDTAKELNVSDGDQVVIGSPVNKVVCHVKVTERIRRRVAQLYPGFNEANANLLTDVTSLDPITGSAPLRSTICWIKKV